MDTAQSRWPLGPPNGLLLAEMQLSVRLENVLRNAGILTCGDARDRTDSDLLRLKGLGRTRLAELRAALFGAPAPTALERLASRVRAALQLSEAASLDDLGDEVERLAREAAPHDHYPASDQWMGRVCTQTCVCGAHRGVRWPRVDRATGAGDPEWVGPWHWVVRP